MACDALINGRGNNCATEIGGFNALYFVETASLDGITYDGATGEIDEMTTIQTSFYKYLVLGATNLDDDKTLVENTGTTSVVTAGTVTLITQSQNDVIELQKIQKGLFSVIAEKRNGTSVLIGYDTSIMVTSLKALRGNGENDLVGYTMDISCKSDRLPSFLKGALKNNPFGGLTTPANYTIVT